MTTKTVIQAEEEFLSSKSKKVTGKKTNILNGKSKIKKYISNITQSQQQETDDNELVNDEADISTNVVVTTKKKSKKSKKSEVNNQSVSVKLSFSKFDTLEKRNANQELEPSKKNCRICSKPVYKMEEIKAVKTIFHKNCFRCYNCNKLLNVDNYQSNEGIIYCTMHFKLLLGPRAVEESEIEGSVSKPKPELIIRENEPVELSPDVIRASTKPDLGLAELQQLNLRSRFELFEHPKEGEKGKPELPQNELMERQRSNAIRMKLSKFQKLSLSEKSEDLDENSANESGDDDELVDIPTRERPIGIGPVMQDIREKFEKGPLLAKHDRREECKQEIQNIRSRLFTGKQARIKEMYQQAVADAEQGITSVGKVENIERSTDTRDIKDRFERGEYFKNNSKETHDENINGFSVQNEVDVFDSGISKKSRSIFMELDANVLAERNQDFSNSPKMHTEEEKKNLRCLNEPEHQKEKEIVKSDQQLEDVRVETSEISSKFKFFEAYRPSVCEKKQFRITPPREGVVKIPTSDSDLEDNDGEALESIEKQLLEKSHTTAKMLNKFREIEESQRRKNVQDIGPKPLKRFTPPPDDNRRVYATNESDEYSSQEDSSIDDDEDEEDETPTTKTIFNDSALKEAQKSARAKSMRAKFEKWEASENQHLTAEQVDVYSKDVSDETNIESTKSIRERFERLQEEERKGPTRPRYQVNRFI